MVKKRASKKKNEEYVVITQRGCPACVALKNEVQGVKYLDLQDSSKAVELANQFNIRAVPAILKVNMDSGKICMLDQKLKTVKCLVDKSILKSI